MKKEPFDKLRVTKKPFDKLRVTKKIK